MQFRELTGVNARKDYFTVDPKSIVVKNGWNPRTDFDGEEELVNSIKENGVINPVRVTKENDKIVLIDGERRLRATLRAIAEGANIVSIPAIVEAANMNEIDRMFVTLLTNEGKKLTPIEEAEAYRRLINWGLSHEEIAKKMGKHVPQIYDRLRLLEASPAVREALKAKEITIAEVKEIVKESSGSIAKQSEKLAEVKEEKELIELHTDKETKKAIAKGTVDKKEVVQKIKEVKEKSPEKSDIKEEVSVSVKEAKELPVKKLSDERRAFLCVDKKSETELYGVFVIFAESVEKAKEELSGIVTRGTLEIKDTHNDDLYMILNQPNGD
jgi:ParB family chromosome partitioning protein